MIRLVLSLVLLLAAGCALTLVPTHEIRWHAIEDPAAVADVPAESDS